MSTHTKLPFKKYGKMSNMNSIDYLSDLRERFPEIDTIEWIIMEKAHGTHFSFQTDGVTVEAGKRGSVLGPDDDFYKFDQLINHYRNKVIDIFNLVKMVSPETTSIQIDGELIGGSYPHPEVDEIEGTLRIQKGIWYSPGHEFYAFDIYMFSGPDEDDRLGNMNYDQCIEMFEKVDMFYAQSIFRGTLSQVEGYSNTFESSLGVQLGNPPIDQNVAEGWVAKPVDPLYKRSGARVIFKNKTDKFKEIGKKKTNQAPPEVPAEVKAVIENMSSLINQNRLDAVLSKIGEYTKKDFGKIMKMFSNDVLTDYPDHYGDSFEILKKEQQKIVTKYISQKGSTLIRQLF